MLHLACLPLSLRVLRACTEKSAVAFLVHLGGHSLAQAHTGKGHVCGGPQRHSNTRTRMKARQDCRQKQSIPILFRSALFTPPLPLLISTRQTLLLTISCSITAKAPAFASAQTLAGRPLPLLAPSSHGPAPPWHPRQVLAHRSGAGHGHHPLPGELAPLCMALWHPRLLSVCLRAVPGQVKWQICCARTSASPLARQQC